MDAKEKFKKNMDAIMKDLAVRIATEICTADEYEETGLGRDDIKRLAKTVLKVIKAP